MHLPDWIGRALRHDEASLRISAPELALMVAIASTPGLDVRDGRATFRGDVTRLAGSPASAGKALKSLAAKGYIAISAGTPVPGRPGRPPRVITFLFDCAEPAANPTGEFATDPTQTDGSAPQFPASSAQRPSGIAPTMAQPHQTLARASLPPPPSTPAGPPPPADIASLLEHILRIEGVERGGDLIARQGVIAVAVGVREVADADRAGRRIENRPAYIKAVALRERGRHPIEEWAFLGHWPAAEPLPASVVDAADRFRRAAGGQR